MSSYLSDETDDRLDRTWAPERVFAATIASNAVDFADRVAVTIPGTDGGLLRWEDVRWQPRLPGQLPKRGDECVVVLDDNNELWIPVWGNNSTSTSDVESVREVGTVGNPSFQNSFTNFGGGWETVGFWKDPFSMVHLHGLVTNASDKSGFNIFTLPTGYRPADNLLFPQVRGNPENHIFTRVDVLDDGSVQPALMSAGNWISLSGISFRIA